MKMIKKLLYLSLLTPIILFPTYSQTLSRPVYDIVMEAFERYGILTVVLPFLLIFSLIFLLLEAGGVLKKDNNDVVGTRLHVAFAFGFALMAAAHQDVIAWIAFLVPSASVWILALFLFVVAMALFGGTRKDVPGWFRGIIFLVSFVVILVLAAYATSARSLQIGVAGDLANAILQYISADIIVLLVIVALFIVLVKWVTSPSRQEEAGGNNTRT